MSNISADREILTLWVDIHTLMSQSGKKIPIPTIQFDRYHVETCQVSLALDLLDKGVARSNTFFTEEIQKHKDLDEAIKSLGLSSKNCQDLITLAEYSVLNVMSELLEEHMSFQFHSVIHCEAPVPDGTLLPNQCEITLWIDHHTRHMTTENRQQSRKCAYSLQFDRQEACATLDTLTVDSIEAVVSRITHTFHDHIYRVVRDPYQAAEEEGIPLLLNLAIVAVHSDRPSEINMSVDPRVHKTSAPPIQL